MFLEGKNFYRAERRTVVEQGEMEVVKNIGSEMQT